MRFIIKQDTVFAGALQFQVSGATGFSGGCRQMLLALCSELVIGIWEPGGIKAVP